MRRQRVKDIVDKAGEDVAAGRVKPDYTAGVISKDQEDNGRFISKYFDTVSNKQYQQLFCQYNPPMFAILLYHMRVVELSKGAFLY